MDAKPAEVAETMLSRADNPMKSRMASNFPEVALSPIGLDGRRKASDVSHRRDWVSACRTGTAW